MAIYHFSIKNIGRSKGRSAVACSAYRSGEKLTDRTYGKEQDYTKKTGVEFKKIYAPQNVKKELLNREELWNAVELAETKKNGDLKTTARLAKEFEVAFPCEISQQQREQMLEDLCNRLVEKHRVVVDAVIHAPHTKGGSDERNYHAHIMFTTRSINDKGELGQKTREFNDDGKNLTLEYRAYWAELANRELEQANTQERVSHLSYKDLKYDLEPTIHEGSKVTQLRRKGIATEISVSNDLIKARNAELLSKKQANNREKWANIPTEEKKKTANSAILQYKRAVSDKFNEMALEVVKQKKDAIRANLSHLEQDLKRIERQKENLGKKPLFFSKKWDIAFGELSNQENILKKRQKELLQINFVPHPENFEEQAKKIIDEKEPRLKKRHDNACKYLAKQKEFEQQKSLEKTKIIREQEKIQPEIKTRRVSRLR